jgi:16S rRNA (cytosine1402-N4)-methyltransferase
MTHQPVLLPEVIALLQVQPGAWYLDATFGAGGHAQAILNQGGRVLALEYDLASYKQAKRKFQAPIFEGKLKLRHDNFANLDWILTKAPEFGASFQFAGALFDLGTSSDQLTSGYKGLSVYENGPLDMRLNSSLAVTARDLLLALPEKQLAQLFWDYGGEKHARALAQAISQEKKRLGQNAFPDSQSLVQVIEKVKPDVEKLHPATKVFQALRIAVNNEIDNLQQVLPQVFKHLQPQGRLVVIAFHEGEDRPVKKFFRAQEKMGTALILTKKPLQPNWAATRANPRSRSAKLRAIEKQGSENEKTII